MRQKHCHSLKKQVLIYPALRIVGRMLKKMLKKLVPLILILIAAGSFFFRQKPYHLNRTLRETAMRLIQVSVLSRTTGVDYRIEFKEYAYSVAARDHETGNWETESVYTLKKGIQCSLPGLRLYFVRGRFAGYEINGNKGPRYILLHYSYPDSERKRSLIFYRSGDWRTIG